MNSDDKAIIVIDGNPVPLLELQFHHQDDPWPGGHRYEGRIFLPWLVDWIKARYGVGTTRALSASDTGLVFGGLRGIASDEARMSVEAQAVNPRFWLNTIEEMIVEDDHVLIRGVCSPAL